MHLFYNQHIDSPVHTLDPEESRHCVRVLRLQENDPVKLTDGKGTMYSGRILDPDPYACRITITERSDSYGARPYRLHMAVAPTKNMERFEWFVEKATEAGVDEISPLICEHSERKTCKTDRSERIAVAALKQCKRAQLPQIHESVLFSDFTKATSGSAAAKAIACCWTDRPRVPLNEWMKSSRESDFIVLIGPEGDFSPGEIDQAVAGGYVPVDLGPSILRTETAALSAVFCASFALGLFGETCQ